jgi:hypothetical protein
MGDFDGHPFRGNQYSAGRGGELNAFIPRVLGIYKPEDEGRRVAIANRAAEIEDKQGWKAKDEAGIATLLRQAKDELPAPAKVTPGTVNSRGQVERETLAEVKARMDRERGHAFPSNENPPTGDQRPAWDRPGARETGGVRVSRGDYKGSAQHEKDKAWLAKAREKGRQKYAEQEAKAVRTQQERERYRASRGGK